MSKTTLSAGTSPFAHLLGGAAALAGRALGKKAEEDTPIDEDGTTNEDVVDNTSDVIEDVDQVDDKEGKKGKKAKKAKGEQDPEADADDKDDDVDAESDDDEKKAAYQRGLAMGRTRENARCSRIFQTAGAAGRPDVAATLAFTTRTTSAEAGRLMSVVGESAAPKRKSLDDRMGNRSDPNPGSGADEPQGKASFADKVAAAKRKAGLA